MTQAVCISCHYFRDFDHHGEPVEGALAANQFAYLCNKCMQRIRENFWTAATYEL